MSGPFGAQQWIYDTGADGFHTTSIGQSLRFNDNDSAYLERTPTTAGNQKTWTWSGWVKRGNLGSTQYLLNVGVDGDYSHWLAFNSSDQFEFRFFTANVNRQRHVTEQVFRDPSAWYHIVCVLDTGNATESDRARLYINGVRVTDFGTELYPTQNFEGLVNDDRVHNLGRNDRNNSDYFDGYLAEVHFTDGTAYDADAFGELKSGVWVAKTPSVTYGTNGFYLDFANSADIGNDVSGEGNDWTPNNFTASDVVLDSPTDNFCTWNPIAKQTGIMAGTSSFSDGNLTVTTGTNNSSAHATFLLSSGKWYWEITYDSNNSIYPGIAYNGSSTNREDGIVYWKDGRKVIDNVFTSYGASYATGDVIGIALDADANSVTFYKNNVSQGAISYTPQSTDPTPALVTGGAGNTTITANFGQLGFTYTPPTDYLALSTANLPEPTISPADDAEPRDYFETFTYTGNGGSLQVGDIIKKPADTIDLTNSLIFNDDDSAYLERTPASAGDRQTWTWSGWVKRGNLGAVTLFSADNSAGNFSSNQLAISAGGNLFIDDNRNTSTPYSVTTSSLLLDPSAWYHIVVVLDTSNATSSDRVRFYINGSRITNFDFASYPALNLDGWINSTVAHYVGRNLTPATGARNYLDGYLAEVHFTDGTAYDASAFGTFDANGIWIPQTPSVTYGTNGFYLDFSDNTSTATLGTDSSGQGNDWTPNNFATTDQVTDSPTDNNFATFNSSSTNMTLSQGNKEANSTSDFESCPLSMKCVGKNYFEIEYVTKSLSNDTIGVVSYSQTTRNWQTAVASGTGTNGRLGYAMTFEYARTDTGQECDEGSVTSSVFTSLSAGDIAQIAVDTETGKIWFGTNGTWENSGDPAAGTNPSATKNWNDFTIAIGGHPTNKFKILNNSDEWNHTAPTGFVALTENNITVDDQNLEKPDFVWIKQRDVTRDHQLFDSVRGVQKALSSNATDAEADAPNMLLDFNINGFMVGSDDAVNQDGGTYAAWSWKAGAAAVTNNVGTIESQVSANTTSGFSIVSYTGTGNSSDTVGHGLGSVPSLIIGKSRDSSSRQWPVKHKDLTSNFTLYLNLTNAQADPADGTFADLDNSSTFGFYSNANSDNVNATGEDYIAYCFAEVEGFSKFGSYEGGSSPVFAYTGFRPAFVLLKRAGGTSDWFIFDDKRLGYNGGMTRLYPNEANAEANFNANRQMQFMANGFEVTGAAGSADNANKLSESGTYIFAAFAAQPFKYSNAR